MSGARGAAAEDAGRQGAWSDDGEAAVQRALEAAWDEARQATLGSDAELEEMWSQHAAGGLGMGGELGDASLEDMWASTSAQLEALNDPAKQAYHFADANPYMEHEAPFEEVSNMYTGFATPRLVRVCNTTSS